jgi:hypothetical protein
MAFLGYQGFARFDERYARSKQDSITYGSGGSGVTVIGSNVLRYCYGGRELRVSPTRTPPNCDRCRPQEYPLNHSSRGLSDQASVMSMERILEKNWVIKELEKCFL